VTCGPNGVTARRRHIVATAKNNAQPCANEDSTLPGQLEPCTAKGIFWSAGACCMTIQTLESDFKDHIEIIFSKRI
jgi:hypothetical protein